MSNDIVRQSGWEKWHDWNMRVMQPVTAWFCDTVAVRTGLNVLDAACGTGIPAIEIAKRVQPGGTVTAADKSAEMLGAAQRDPRSEVLPAA